MSYSGGEHFNKLAKSRGYRSRAAFKLHQINNKFNLLKKGCSVMDLGSSPGGWSQVAKELVGNSGKVFALDIIPMKPINGVEFIEFDFRDKDIKKFINYSPIKGIFIKKYSQMLNAKFVNQSQSIRPYYLRMSVLNKVGVLKSIAQLFSQKSISIKSIIQLNTNNEKVVPIIIISDPVGIKNITQVVNNLKKTSFIKNEISVIRIEENIG